MSFILQCCFHFCFNNVRQVLRLAIFKTTFQEREIMKFNYYSFIILFNYYLLVNLIINSVVFVLPNTDSCK